MTRAGDIRPERVLELRGANLQGLAQPRHIELAGFTAYGAQRTCTNKTVRSWLDCKLRLKKREGLDV